MSLDTSPAALRAAAADAKEYVRASTVEAARAILRVVDETTPTVAVPRTRPWR